MPNTQLWTTGTIGNLMNEDAFIGGGWWHDKRVLEATGEGVAVEELRGWEGWWNEEIVSLNCLLLCSANVQRLA